MNYYSHHIGDYLTDTAHLSILEDGAYRRLLDRYYTNESPITSDEAALFRVLRARSEDEKEAARLVLNEFFILTESGWMHKRCEAEIAAFREKSGKATDAANKRWNKQVNADALRTHTERNADAVPTKPINQEPRTSNQEPVTKSLLPAKDDESNSVEIKTSEKNIIHSPGELTKAMRSHGIMMQPGDPRVVEIAKQGVSPETVSAACEHAKKAKPGESIAGGYIIAILQTWARDAAQIKVAGATSPQEARASPGRSTSRHVGLEKLDYNEGIGPDGRIN